MFYLYLGIKSIFVYFILYLPKCVNFERIFAKYFAEMLQKYRRVHVT